MLSITNLWVLATASLAVASNVPRAASCTTSTLTHVSGAHNGTTTVTSTKYLKTTTVTKASPTRTVSAETVFVYTTVTSPSPFTFYTTVAPSTTTIPAASDFTPWASLQPTIAYNTTTTGRNAGVSAKRTVAKKLPRNGIEAAVRRQRRAVSSSSSSSASTSSKHATTSTVRTTSSHTTTTTNIPNATQVRCSTTITRATSTHTKDTTSFTTTTPTYTVTNTAYYAITYHTTVHTSVATVYEACVGDSNLGTSFRGEPVDFVQAFGGVSLDFLYNDGYSSDPPPLPAGMQAGNQSPRDCCNAVNYFAAHLVDSTSGYTPEGYLFSGSVSEESIGICNVLTGRGGHGGPFGTYFWTGGAAHGPVVLGNAGSPEYQDWIYEGACDTILGYSNSVYTSGYQCPYAENPSIQPDPQ